MSEVIQISLDSQGRIVIPSISRHHPGLSQGMILVVEEGEKDVLFLRIQKESPTLIDKQGVLVVKAEPSVDLTNITQQERNRRVFDLVQRVRL
ncbi:hypothetical protein FJZ31_01335 [Candidatus Poribacteria bacterium]|nr:hypothetical protein [Candidatus Poribacteria bacterium]